MKSSSSLAKFLILSLGLAVAGISHSSQASNVTWNLSGTDNSWATAANWSATTPVNNDTIEFVSGAPTFTLLNNNISSLTLNGITFDSGAAAYTIYGNSFTLNGGITNNSASIQRINTAIALAATETVNANTGTVNLSGVVSGATFGLTKTGSGLLNLTAANTYTGATTISSGTLGIVADNNLGTSAAALSLDGGTLKVTGGTTPVNTHALSVTSNGGTISNVGFAYTLNATLSGSNTLNLTGPTAGSVGYAGPVVNGLGNYGNFNVNGTSTFSGTINVGTGANIEYGSTTALSSATINVNSGGRLSASVNGTIGANITVADGGNLAFQNNNTGIFGGTITLSGGTANVHMFDWYNYGTGRNGAISGKITGAGGLNVLAGGATLTVSGATNDYTGATTLNNVGLTVNGSGTIAGSSGTTVNNSTITLDYGTVNVDKLKDTGAVTESQNSFLVITPNTTTNTTETIGTLGFAGGNSTVTISSAASRVTTLAASDLSRTNNSTALIRGTSLDQSAGTNVSRLTLADGGASLALVGTNTLNNGATTDSTLALKIVPYLVGDTAVANNGRQFLTYDTTLGLRALQSGEYTVVTSGYTTAASPDNLALGSSTTVTLSTTSDVTINSFKFGSANATLNGSGGKLIINSGAILAADGIGGSVIGSGFSGLTLGNGTWNEGVITTAGAAGAVTVNTPISVTGGGGLTKAGAGTLTLGATNAYTGQTTINQGTLAVTAGVNNVFNGTTGTAVVLGNNATLNIGSTTQAVTSIGFYGSGETVSGASGTLNLGGDITQDTTVNPNAASTISVTNLNLNSTRNVTVGYSPTIFSASTTNLSQTDLIISSIIANGSGASGLTKAGLGTLALTASNTYTGTTTINSGTLLIGNNGATGSLAAAGTIVDNATLGFSRTGTVTQGTDFSSAAISGTGGITNFGAGTVVLNAANSFSGAVNILNGTVSVAGIGNSGANSNLGTNGTINLGSVGVGNVAVTATLLYTGGGETTDKVINLTGYASNATSILDASGSGLLKFTSAVTGVDGSKTMTLQGTGTGELAGGLNDFSTGLMSVTKTGTGTWTLSGNNSYSGPTTVSSGTLNVTGALGGNTAVTVSNSGTALNVTNTNGLNGTSSLTVNSGATATLSAANNFIGATALTGTLQLRNADAIAGSALTMNNGSTLQLRADADTTFNTNGTNIISSTSNGVQTFSFTFDVGAATSASNKTLTLGGTVSLTQGGSIGFDQTTINVTGTSGFTLALGNLITEGSGSGSNLNLNPSSGLTLTLAALTQPGGSNPGVVTFTGAGNTSVIGAVQKGTNRSLTLNFSQTGTVTLNSAAGLGGSGNFNAANLNAGTTIFNNAAAVNNQQINLGNQTAASTDAATFLLGGSTGLNGGLTYTGAVRAYDTTSGLLTLGGQNTSGINAFSNTVTLGNTTDTGKSINLVAAPGGEVDFNGVIAKNGADTTSAVTVNGAYTVNGVTVNPTGSVKMINNNTFGGGLTIMAGTLIQGGAASVLGSGTITVGDGATSASATLLGAVSATTTVANAITIASGGSGTYTIADTVASDYNFSGPVALNNAATFSVTGAGQLQFLNTITGSSLITIDGGGTGTKFVKLSADNSASFTGNVLIQNGNANQSGLKLGASNALSNANTVTIDANSAIDLGGFNLSVAGLNDVVTGAGGSVITGTGNITLGGSGTYSFSGVINNTGTKNLTKSGTGTQTLAGSNTYTGATTISLGTLQIGSGGTSGSISGTSGVTNNAALVYNRSDPLTVAYSISGSGAVTQAGSGTLTLSASNSYSGITTITSGALQVGNGGTSGTLGSGNVVDNTSLVFDRSDSVLVNNLISGMGSFTQAGGGVTTLGNSANTYGGATIITGGTLSVSTLADSGVASSIGSGSSVVLNGGTLQYTGNGIVTDRLITVGTNGGGIDASGVGAVNFSNPASIGYNSQSGPRTLTLTGSYVDIAAPTGLTNNIFGSGIGDSGGATSLVKSGVGTWILPNANSYSGGTTITGGNLVVMDDSALGTGAVTFNGSGATLSSIGAHSLSNAISTALGSGAIGGNSDLALNGVISGGNGMVINNTGITTYGASNTYTGSTTINSGATLTAAVAGALATGSSSTITVNNGGTLIDAASNAIGTNTASAPKMELAGGTLQVANAVTTEYVGALTLQNTTMSTLDFVSGGSGSVITFASLNGMGTLNIANWNGSTSGGGPDQLIFAQDQSGNLGQFSFAGYGGVAEISLGGGLYEIVPVPEPGTIIGALLLAGFVGYRERRRVRGIYSKMKRKPGYASC